MPGGADGADPGKPKLKTYAQLSKSLQAYKKQYGNWLKRYASIVERYRYEMKDDSSADNNSATGARLNVLYANTSILQGATYNHIPAPLVMRRFADKDPVGRVGCDVLQRCVKESMEESGFDDTTKAGRDDWLLGGRGTNWIRYEAEFGDEEDDGDGGTYSPVVAEKVEVDYVAPEDYAHAPARIWRDVTWAARRLYMTKKGYTNFFGKEKADKATFTPRRTGPGDLSKNYSNSDTISDGVNEDKQSGVPRAEVWELWDRDSQRVYFFTTEKGDDGMIDTRPIPYKLHGFFPCARPLYGIMTNNTLVPVPDYMQYQDQALEIDDATTRMGMLLKAIKVACLYDSSLGSEVKALFEGSDLEAIPVDDFMTKYVTDGVGNISGHMAFTPINMFVEAYLRIREGRTQLLEDIDMVTGISDVVRGQTDATETLGTQQMKGGYFNQRLAERQKQVARYARDTVNIMAEIICQKFSAETMLEMSGAQFMDPASQANLGPALAMLKDANARTFRVDIETNSTVAIEEAEDKQQRLEFLTTIGGFLEKAVQLGNEQPLLVPVLKESIMFAVRAFKVGRQLEGEIEETLEKIVLVAQKAAAAQEQSAGQPPPDPEMMKANAQIAASNAKTQAQIQASNAKTQADIANDQMRTQAEVQAKAVQAQTTARERMMDAMMHA